MNIYQSYYFENISPYVLIEGHTHNKRGWGRPGQSHPPGSKLISCSIASQMIPRMVLKSRGIGADGVQAHAGPRLQSVPRTQQQQ